MYKRQALEHVVTHQSDAAWELDVFQIYALLETAVDFIHDVVFEDLSLIHIYHELDPGLVYEPVLEEHVPFIVLAEIPDPVNLLDLDRCV